MNKSPKHLTNAYGLQIMSSYYDSKNGIKKYIIDLNNVKDDNKFITNKDKKNIKNNNSLSCINSPRKCSSLMNRFNDIKPRLLENDLLLNINNINKK